VNLTKHDYREIIFLLLDSLNDFLMQLGGHDIVAEITGRKGRLVRDPSGMGVVYESRNT
jgi:hypothetical protein